MQVFVLRHGQAEMQQSTDEVRNLTAKGRLEVAANIKASLSEFGHLQEIWVSPLVRARQTAQIVCDLLANQKVFPVVKTSDQITPDGDPSVLFEVLQASHLTSVLLVSHQPFVGSFIANFCGGPAGAYPMDPGSLALIECDVAARSCGELRWLRHVPV